MVDLRRLTFTKARITALIRDVKGKAKLPVWVQKPTIRNGKLYIDGKLVIAKSDIDSWLRQRAYDKNQKPMNMSRDGGFTDFVAKETIGISRRVWHDWLRRQATVQQGKVRAKPTKNPGQKIHSRGIVEIDLVEAKARDLPGSRKTDTYFFNAADKLTGYMVCLQTKTKEVNPEGARDVGRVSGHFGRDGVQAWEASEMDI